MLRTRMVLPLGVMLLAAMAPALGACKLELIATIDVELDGGGTVMVPVKANGHEAWMPLRMASGVPTIYEAAARQLGLKFQRQGDVNMKFGDKSITHKVVVDELLVGTANFAKWDMYVRPDQGRVSMFRDRMILGGLTSRFMSVVDVELNLGEKKLNLFRQTIDCRGQQVYWGEPVTAVNIFYDTSGLMVFPMEVDGTRVEAALLTQSRTSLISEKVTRKFFGFDRDSSGITNRVDADGDEPVSYRAMALTAKGLEIKDINIRLYDDLESSCTATAFDRRTRAVGFEDCRSMAPLSIGTDLLKLLRIYIAPREGKIYFTRAMPSVAAPADTAAAVQVPAGPE